MDPALDLEPSTAVDHVHLLHQVRTFTRWVGDGRALTQTGRVTLADARELAALLDTGDRPDPAIGKLASSAELPGLSLVVSWAKACRLVRVTRGRLVGVKKNAPLLDRPEELWDRMFDTFVRLGDALCQDGWAESFLRDQFEEAIGTLLLATHRAGGTIAIHDACELAWEIVTARYYLDGAPEQHRTTWRMTNDRDVRRALETLEQFGAMRRDGDAMTLTELGLARMRRIDGDAAPGDAILQLKVSLMHVSGPRVWRRLLVPADIRLDRLHDVIQTTVGWTDSHLHAFTARDAHYGPPNPDLDHRDERKAKLNRLIGEPGDRMRYAYDFGDFWEHEIVVEKVLEAEPGVRYPVCSAGKGRCPPEDCGGPWGYASLRETLADPAREEHAEMLEWLGLESAAQFDAAAFDVEEVNALL